MGIDSSWDDLALFLSYELSRKRCLLILLHQLEHWAVKIAHSGRPIVLLCFSQAPFDAFYISDWICETFLDCFHKSMRYNVYGTINILLKSEMFLWSNLKLWQAMLGHILIWWYMQIVLKTIFCSTLCWKPYFVEVS